MSWSLRSAKPILSPEHGRLEEPDASLHLGETVTKSAHQISAALSSAEVLAYANTQGGPIFAGQHRLAVHHEEAGPVHRATSTIRGTGWSRRGRVMQPHSLALDEVKASCSIPCSQSGPAGTCLPDVGMRNSYEGYASDLNRAPSGRLRGAGPAAGLRLEHRIGGSNSFIGGERPHVGPEVSGLIEPRNYCYLAQNGRLGRSAN